MDRHQWTQEIGGLRPMAEIASSSACSRQPVAAEKKARPQRDQSLNCPRCHSTNTKFCYYNNYSLTQPRYFCKACRRYWTEGGTLRNVPVGGGSRKNKRSVPITPSQKLPDLNPPDISQFASQNPNKIMNEGQDLNLGFPGSLGVHQHASQLFDLPKILDRSSSQNQLKSSSCGNSSSTGSTPFAALELLRTGFASRGMNSFVTSTGSPGPDYSGFFFQDLKPAAVSFTVDGLGNSRYVVDPRGVQENGGRVMFPLGAMKQAPPPPPSSSSEGDQNNKGQISNLNGFWNGMLGGGSW